MEFTPTPEYFQNARTELSRGFANWQAKARLMQRMVQPSPGIAVSSARMSGRVGSDIEAAAAELSEYVSAKTALIKNNLVGRMTNLPPKIEPQILAETPEEQERQRRFFQLVHGWHNVLNDHEQSYGGGTSWDRSVAEQGATSGKHVGFPHVYRRSPGSKTVTVECELLDPLTVYHDFDDWPRRVVHETAKGVAKVKLDLAKYFARFEISSEARKVLEDAEPKNPEEQGRAVSLARVWVEVPVDSGEEEAYEVWCAFLVDGKYAGHYLTDFEHMPIVIVSTHAAPGAYQDFRGGSSSYVQADGSSRGIAADRVLNHAAPFYAPLYYSWLQERHTMSQALEGLFKALNPGWIFNSRDGSWVPDQQLLGSGAGLATSAEENQEVKIQPVPTAQVGEAMRLAMEHINNEYNLLYNEVMFGVSAQGDSGYLNVNKVSHAIATVQEVLKGVSIFEKRVFDEMMHQFVKSGLSFKVKKFQLHGKGAPQNFEGGDFSYKDVPEQYLINVETNIALPQNEPQKLEVGTRAKEQRFLSRREIMANILDNPDPDRTMALIEQEEYEDSPPVKARRFLQKMREEIEALEDAAANASSRAERILLKKQAMYAQQDLNAAIAQMQGLVQNRMGQPGGLQGFTPETMPPELGVGSNADRNAEARGEVSSFTGGKPRTAQPQEAA